MLCVPSARHLFGTASLASSALSASAELLVVLRVRFHNNNNNNCDQSLSSRVSKSVCHILGSRVTTQQSTVTVSWASFLQIFSFFLKPFRSRLKVRHGTDIYCGLVFGYFVHFWAMNEFLQFLGATTKTTR